MCKNDEFKIVKRCGVMIWVYSLKNLKTLKKFGLLHYVSKRMKYVVIYVDQIDCEEVVARIQKLHFVRKVDVSYRPNLEMDFASRTSKRSFVAAEEEEPFEIEELTTQIKLVENV